MASFVDRVRKSSCYKGWGLVAEGGGGGHPLSWLMLAVEQGRVVVRKCREGCHGGRWADDIVTRSGWWWR